MKQNCMMNVKLVMAGVVLAVLPLAQSVQAALANTGVGVSPGGVDSNWSVSSALGSGPAAYLATPSTQWPFSPAGPWVADDSSSSWITYGTPLNLNAPADTYTYTENFTLTSAETLAVRFLSDNESSLYLQNGSQTLIATKGSPYDTSTFSMWSPYYYLNLSSGSYSFQIVVNNDASSTLNGNPTGVRFEEYEVASPVVSSVPESATFAAGALVLIPLCIGLLRGMRKESGVLKLS